MHPISILAVGITIVIGGVLLLRLHAMLALILAAIAVAALTPEYRAERYWLERKAIAFRTDHSLDHRNGDQANVILAIGPKQGAQPGMQYVVLRATSPDGQMEQIATLAIGQFLGAGNDGKISSVARFVNGQENAPLQASDIVVHSLDRAEAIKQSQQTVGERVAGGFGSTCGKIGILIAMAAIIGKCLLDSGAADRIVRWALSLLGIQGAPLAFLASGFLLAIPVFFDTVFYLMIPLGKALHMRVGKNYLLYVLTIVAGATMAHSLVPPTPGPLFVADQLGVDLGLMILAGCSVGLFTSAAGYCYALAMNARHELPLRESPDLSLDDLQKLSQRDISQLPPLWLSLLPIVLPVVLIGGYTALKSMPGPLSPDLMKIAATLGNKNIALVIAAAISLAMLAWQRREGRRKLAESVQAALSSGGTIILITASGGAFGAVIQQTGVAALISQLPLAGSLMLIVVAFFITMAVRTAQGSATVAMITSVGILAGIAGGDLGFHPVYLALAIGCGSKPIAWMNDSGFWVICKISGMTEAEGLKYISPLSILMGFTGLAVTLAAAWLMPMAS